MIILLDKFNRVCHEVIKSEHKHSLFVNYLRKQLFKDEEEERDYCDIDSYVLDSLTSRFINYCNPQWDVKKLNKSIKDALFDTSDT